MNTKLTVFFEDPFWVGVFERSYDCKLEVARVVFGSEPKDYEIYEYVLEKYTRLRFTKPVAAEKTVMKRINPKRLQRKIQREIKSTGIGTKAQIAMKLEYEAKKEERKIIKKQRKNEIQKIKFKKKQQKKKDKKKGH